MKTSHICIISFSLAFLVLLPSVAKPASPTVTYKVVDFGAVDQTLGEVVRGPSISSEVIGGSAGFGSGPRAFLMTNSTLKDLGGLSGTDRGVSRGINELGVVVGSSNTATSLLAFLWTRRGGSRDLGTLPGDSVAKRSESMATTK